VTAKTEPAQDIGHIPETGLLLYIWLRIKTIEVRYAGVGVCSK